MRRTVVHLDQFGASSVIDTMTQVSEISQYTLGQESLNLKLLLSDGDSLC